MEQNTSNGSENVSALQRLRREYMSSLKSMDTEEHIDLWFYRPMGFCVAKCSKAVGITPNFITIVSIVLGIAAGIAFYFSSMWINVAGMLLLICANTLDSADGQLARMTKNYSKIGRILDGMAGDTWFITIYIAICLREVATSGFFMEHNWAIWVLASLAGLSHIKQAQMADYYRQFHLYSLSDRAVTELENIDELKADYKAIPWKGHFIKKLTMKVYLNYSLQQAASTPAMQRLLTALRGSGMDEASMHRFKENLRRESLPLMKYTNILSFNWRTITLFVSLFLMMPWIYFVMELTVFNFILLYMRWRHERMCRKLLEEIKSHEN